MIGARTLGRALALTRDRLFHSSRRATALRSLADRPVRRVLVLCHANVCRSPFAAAALARHLTEAGRSDIAVMSAGVSGAGRPTPAAGIEVASAMGVDLSGHRSHIVTSQMLGESDIIVVMSADQAEDARWRGAASSIPVIVLGDLDPVDGHPRSIQDPWNGDADAFRDSYMRIDRCVRELAAAIGRLAGDASGGGS